MKAVARRVVGARPQVGAWTVCFFLVLLALIIAGCSQHSATDCIELSPRPGRVQSGSMAATYLGPHWQVECGNCGLLFPVGADFAPDDKQASCPNCAYEKNSIHGEPLKGAAVEIIELAADSPSRWDVVAFAEPGSQDRVAIKRVVALPGEEVVIRGGDLWIDGQLAVKDLEIYRQMRQLVFDEQFQPPPSDREKLASRLILDDLAYNQSLARELFPAVDTSVAVDVDFAKSAEIHVPANPESTIIAKVSTGEYQIYRDSQELASGEIDLHGVHRVELSHIDGRVSLAIDGELQTYWQSPPQDAADDFSIRRQDLRCVNCISGTMTVHRDVVYLDPSNRTNRWAYKRRLREDEYFVLGDNPAGSTDSRHYGPIQRDAILGIVQPAK